MSSFKHGMRDTKFFKNWCAMRYRCSNKKSKGYKNWGGRGITVCQRWQDFILFKKDMYKKYLNHVKKYGIRQTSIDRIDNNKGYYLENCKWATRFEQNSNKRKNTIIEFGKYKLTMSEWARKIGVDRATILYRIFKAKWPIERALRIGDDPRAGIPRKKYIKIKK